MKKGFRKNFKLTRKVFSYPYILFLTVFVVVPLSLLLVNAFLVDGKLSFDNFKEFFSGKASLLVLANSIIVGLVTTGLCLLLGYPVAYLLVKFNAGKMFVLLFILPMWVNFLIRTLATKAIFVALGVKLGMFTVVFGMVYNYLPFMILPLFSIMTKIDRHVIEAALHHFVWHGQKLRRSGKGPRRRSYERARQNDFADEPSGHNLRHNHGVHSDHIHFCDQPASVGQHNLSFR